MDALEIVEIAFISSTITAAILGVGIYYYLYPKYHYEKVERINQKNKQILEDFVRAYVAEITIPNNHYKTAFEKDNANMWMILNHHYKIAKIEISATTNFNVQAHDAKTVEDWFNTVFLNNYKKFKSFEDVYRYDVKLRKRLNMKPPPAYGENTESKRDISSEILGGDEKPPMLSPDEW